MLQGCTVEDEAFVGMGATLLDGVVVEKHGMVAAGALVRQNTRIPCGEVDQHFLNCPLLLVLTCAVSSTFTFSFLFFFLFHSTDSTKAGFSCNDEPK